MTRETTIEKYLKRRVEDHGGTCEKFVTPNRRGAQDRLVCWPNHIASGFGYKIHKADAHFIEVKRPGKEPTEQQERNASRRRMLGFWATYVNSHTLVDQYIRDVCATRDIAYLDPPPTRKPEAYT